MWFKNLIFYRLPTDWALQPTEFEAQLAERRLQPCGPFDLTSRGWMPVTQGGRLLHTVNQQHMIALGENQKLLPGSIIRQVAQERAEVQAQDQGFPVGRKQMRDLRLKVADELRAKALTRRRVTRAWIDQLAGWLVIDAATIPRAEAVIDTLRVTLGSFAPVLIETERSPHSLMASWLLRGRTDSRFTIDDDLELQSADKSKTVIRYTRHPLNGPEIQAHLKGGKYPTRLGLTWSDRVSFALTDKMIIKKLEFLEVAEPNSAEELEPAEKFDVDFIIMTAELANLLKDLAHALSPASHALPTTRASSVKLAAA